MNEVSAAMGLTGLAAIDTLVAHNHRNHAAYAEALRACPACA